MVLNWNQDEKQKPIVVLDSFSIFFIKRNWLLFSNSNFQTINSARSISQSLKNKRFTPSCCKDITIWKLNMWQVIEAEGFRIGYP